MRMLALASCLSLFLVACSERPQMSVEPNPVVANTVPLHVLPAADVVGHR